MHFNWVLCSGPHKAETSVSQLHSHLEAQEGKIHFQVFFGGWQNSFPCGCRTYIPAVFLAVGKACSQLLEVAVSS